MTEKMPSSVRFGSRSRIDNRVAYSSGFKPCSATMASVMVVLERLIMGSLCQSPNQTIEQSGAFGTAVARIDCILGVRHQAEHCFGLVEDTGDVPT